MRLGPPILAILKGGEYERYRAEIVAKGASDATTKPPVLKKDPQFINNFQILDRIDFTEIGL
jgi:hypothetical protein